MWGQKVRVIFPCLKANPKAKAHRRPRDEAPFDCECYMALRKLPGSSELSRHQKELFWELVVGSASDPLVKQLRWSLGEIPSQWNWVPGSSFWNNSFSLRWRLARNALPLNDWAFRACLADIPECLCCGNGLEETALHTFYHCERVRPFWSHVKSRWPVSVPSSLCCSTLVTSWTILILLIKVRSVWCFSQS